MINSREIEEKEEVLNTTQEICFYMIHQTTPKKLLKCTNY